MQGLFRNDRAESNGEQVDSKHIVKHKKDVFRLVAMLAPADTYEVPDSLKQDVDRFCLAVKEEVPNSDFSNRQDLKAFPENSYWNNLKPIS